MRHSIAGLLRFLAFLSFAPSCLTGPMGVSWLLLNGYLPTDLPPMLYLAMMLGSMFLTSWCMPMVLHGAADALSPETSLLGSPGEIEGRGDDGTAGRD